MNGTAEKHIQRIYDHATLSINEVGEDQSGSWSGVLRTPKKWGCHGGFEFRRMLETLVGPTPISGDGGCKQR